LIILKLQSIKYVVIHRDGYVLCVRRSLVDTRSGEWENPGGHIEEGETAQEAAIREVKEETNLDITLHPRSFVIASIGARVYMSKSVKGILKLNPLEHDAYKWVRVDNLDKMHPSPPNYAENIRRVLRLNGKLPNKNEKYFVLNLMTSKKLCCLHSLPTWRL